MRPRLLLALVSATILLSQGLAQAPLALKHGVYVQTGTPCTDPPNAAIVLWDGIGFSGAHDSKCTTMADPPKKNGTRRITTTCNALGDGTPTQSSTVTQRITLRGDHSFTLKGEDGAGKPSGYRWCADRMH